jgi:hypothetical protein
MSRIVTKIITVLFGFDIERQKARLKISPQPNLTQPTDCHITTIQFFFVMVIRYIKCDFSHALFSSKIKLIVRLNQIILKEKKNIVTYKIFNLTFWKFKDKF